MKSFSPPCLLLLCLLYPGCVSEEERSTGDAVSADATANTHEQGPASDASAPSAPTPQQAEPPAIAQIIWVEAAAGDGAVTLYWSIDSAATVSGFQVRYVQGQRDTTLAGRLVVHGDTEATIEPLENGKPLHAAVQVITPDGEMGPLSVTVTATPQRMIPSEIFVPAGHFQMGWDQGLNHHDESPAHTRWTDSFSLDRYPVTWGEFIDCVEAASCEVPPTWSAAIAGLGQVHDVREASAAMDHPAANLTWSNAVSLCRYRGMRLPTEAEWEKAARGSGPDLYPYPWGGMEPACEDVTFSVQGEPCTLGTRPVGSAPHTASPYGAQGMAGGLFEWTADWYAEDAYSQANKSPQGPDTGSARVMRGGAWNAASTALFTTARAAFAPELESSSSGNGSTYWPIGVRCVRDLSTETP